MHGKQLVPTAWKTMCLHNTRACRIELQTRPNRRKTTIGTSSVKCVSGICPSPARTSIGKDSYGFVAERHPIVMVQIVAAMSATSMRTAAARSTSAESKVKYISNAKLVTTSQTRQPPCVSHRQVHVVTPNRNTTVLHGCRLAVWLAQSCS